MTATELRRHKRFYVCKSNRSARQWCVADRQRGARWEIFRTRQEARQFALAKNREHPGNG
jgi:hypothetical protein